MWIVTQRWASRPWEQCLTEKMFVLGTEVLLWGAMVAKTLFVSEWVPGREAQVCHEMPQTVPIEPQEQ